MNIEALALAGAHRIHVQRLSDDRGHFARLWCRGSLAAAGLSLEVVQTSASVNPRAGTLRGLHFAWPPSGEIKVVRCARGRLHDVLLDLRPHSATFGRSVTVVLDATLHDTLLVPPGVAHGFQTLVDDTEVHYMMTEAYLPALADGVRHDDPQFGIHWPLPVACISERDRNYPDFDAVGHRRRFDAANLAAVHGASDAA